MIPFIPIEKMENLTQNILRDYGLTLDHSVSPTPIPIEEIIEFHYGLEIAWEDIDHLKADGIVMAAIYPTEKTIVMNDSQKVLFEEKIGTRNFTFAHELGHWVLHATDETQLSLELETDKKVFYCRSKSKKPPEEFQADMFAGCILMPRPIIVSSINKIKAERTVTWKDLYILKDSFDVSISALKVRIEQLELLHFVKKTIYNSKEEEAGQISFNF
jgi:Zn-dependent peptidase ImmA (M78 family)